MVVQQSQVAEVQLTAELLLSCQIEMKQACPQTKNKENFIRGDIKVWTKADRLVNSHHME